MILGKILAGCVVLVSFNISLGAGDFSTPCCHIERSEISQKDSTIQTQNAESANRGGGRIG
ncbi:hypothetical protein [Helicobacter sp. 23-1045]